MIADEIRAFLARHPMPQAELARLLEPEEPRFKDTLNRWLGGSQTPRHPGTLKLALETLDRHLANGGSEPDFEDLPF